MKFSGIKDTEAILPCNITIISFPVSVVILKNLRTGEKENQSSPLKVFPPVFSSVLMMLTLRYNLQFANVSYIFIHSHPHNACVVGEREHSSYLLNSNLFWYFVGSRFLSVFAETHSLPRSSIFLLYPWLLFPSAWHVRHVI